MTWHALSPRFTALHQYTNAEGEYKHTVCNMYSQRRFSTTPSCIP